MWWWVSGILAASETYSDGADFVKKLRRISLAGFSKKAEVKLVGPINM